MLVIADVHGKFETLQKIMDDVENESFDIIVAPGDFTDMFDTPTNFTQLDVADMEIQKMMIPGKPILCVPGNHDPYEILNVFDEYETNLHHKKKKISGITFVGWGGAVTPFNTLFEPTEEETKETLRKLTGGLGEKWVLVSHAPPKNTKLDAVNKSHVGSVSIRKIIEESGPDLVISAHIHENSGEDKLGKSRIFYPGPAYKGFYGIVEMDRNKTTCRIKKVNV